MPAEVCVFWFGACVEATGQSSGNLILANIKGPLADQSIPNEVPTSTCSLLHPHNPADVERPLESTKLPFTSNMQQKIHYYSCDCKQSLQQWWGDLLSFRAKGAFSQLVIPFEGGGWGGGGSVWWFLWSQDGWISNPLFQNLARPQTHTYTTKYPSWKK